MLRIIRYLRPFLPLIVLSIVLLFLQANGELALPDYTARIVNVGIQQNGIESAVPQAVRASQMDKLLIFVPESDRETVLSAYQLVDSESPDYERYQREYTALTDEPLYVLTQTDGATRDLLNPILARAFTAVNGIEQAIANPEMAAAMMGSNAIDLSLIPEGTDVFALLRTLPSAMTQPLFDAMNEQFSLMEENMLVQSAIAGVRAEYVALGVDIEALQTNYIVTMGLIMILITLGASVCAIIVNLLAAQTAAGFARDVRSDVFSKVTSFSNLEFDQFSTASLITRTTNDITQIQMIIVLFIRIVCYAPILGVGGVVKATATDASMWWVIALAVFLLILLILTLFVVALPKFRIIQNLIDRLNLVTRENLSGMMVIRAFNTQAFEEKRFDTANRDLIKVNLFTSRVFVVMMPVMMLILNMLSVVIIWVGTDRVASSTIQVGDLMAFIQYAMQVVFSFLMMSMMFIFLPRAFVSADRIAEVLDVKLSIHDAPSPKPLPEKVKGVVEFRDVSFRYPGAEEDVLKNISFTANVGETTAFIGSTGSGKSTLINLIPRFYDVTEGVILVDGVDIRDVTQHDLRDQIGFVPQKATLFSGTIESNLRYGDEGASEGTLALAAEIAQAANFIAERPEGFESSVSQGGTNLSGGQRQRLSIARALVKQPPIFIFDDSFSALDLKTDAALRRALKEKIAETAILIVTQRVSTIMSAEQIIVLDQGRVVGKGTHDELMATNQVYREIAESQITVEAS